jgi:hypothetical protein
MAFTKRWCNIDNDAQNYSTKRHLESMNYVFANCSDDDEIYPLTMSFTIVTHLCGSHERKLSSGKLDWKATELEVMKHKGSWTNDIGLAMMVVHTQPPHSITSTTGNFVVLLLASKFSMALLLGKPS